MKRCDNDPYVVRVAVAGVVVATGCRNWLWLKAAAAKCSATHDSDSQTV
jgi:hypothetical protein